MKKLTIFTLAIVLIFILAACNGGGNNPYSSATIGDIIQLGGLDWLVINVHDNKALILSDKILEDRIYHSSREEITWEQSTLRQYLNGAFYENTFTATEKEFIIETTLKTEESNDTNDKVFLLSIDEINTYMGDEAHINIRNARIATHIVLERTSDWWLRSPCPSRTDSAATVDGGDYYGGLINSSWFDSSRGVRPALWLSIE